MNARLAVVRAFIASDWQKENYIIFESNRETGGAAFIRSDGQAGVQVYLPVV